MSYLFRLTAITALVASVIGNAGYAQPIPDDFPRFVVPGEEKAMASLRALYYQHYQPPAGPLATLWDEWMSDATLWPAVETGGRMPSLRTRWAQALSRRDIDAAGYVATHQHASIAHQQGWPFPFWAQGTGTWGWHFSLQGVPQGWHGTTEKTQEAWELIGGQDVGITDHAWNIKLTDSSARVRTPVLDIDVLQSPFVQLRWRAEGLDDAQPYLEWTTEEESEFGPERRFYFPAVSKGEQVVRTMIPVFKSSAWRGRITRLGICFDNAPGATAGIQSLFTQYDTRHNINNPCFVRGCCQYFWWTRDLVFLRDNLQRIRLAMRYCMEDLGGIREKCIATPWVGHDGRSGIVRDAEGRKIVRPGYGIGNNYWDLLPMGYKDAYATIHYYDALKDMARLENEIAAHPEWNLPAGPLVLRPERLLSHAREVKEYAGKAFWNDATGRFTCGLDSDGKFYDYGYTFVNCEAIYYGFATDDQAQSIMTWLDGRRVVEGDTSQGKDIYRWRFAPRASTKRNIDWYGWFWSSPEKIPFGDQVQDGGAVLGFSYHDLMSRLKVIGPDSAWMRLKEITAWYDEVQAAGGYREYYKDGARGRLQGGGTPGGLGLDKEFFESILVPQVILNGFMGFEPRVDGFTLHPRIPSEWSSLQITRIALQRLVLDVTADGDGFSIDAQGRTSWPTFVYPPAGEWRFVYLDTGGGPSGRQGTVTVGDGTGIPLEVDGTVRIRLNRAGI